MKISALFKDEPVQWGLRGDPFLWRELGERLEGVEIPPTPAELQLILEETYTVATGRPLTDEPPFQVERFNHGGLSGGGISPKFWIERGFPLLVGRHVKP